jgi:large subunit ribosomal protein L21
VLRITEILTNDNKPTIGPRPKREKPVIAAPVDDDDEAPRAVKKKAPPKKAPAKAAAKPRAKPDARKAPAKKK